MSNTSSTASGLWTLAFWTFIVVKVGGTALASWSWWWILLPIVPVIVFVLNAAGVNF